MAAAKPFAFICGPDDFLVGRVGQERFKAAAAGLDELSREVISGFTANVSEVETVVKRFREAVQTLDLFGGRRAVWLKDVNFLADTVTGRAEGTLALVEQLRELLEAVRPDDVAVVITASPVDRRRSFPKWCESHGAFELVGDTGRGRSIDWGGLAREALEPWKMSISEDALELLVAKTCGNARLVTSELLKLAAYIEKPDGTIEEGDVEAVVPAFGEGDFFEVAEAFFARDLAWTLDALRRHFFAGNDARPVISSLQNRNRLLIQLRALMLGGGLRVSPRGVDKAGLERTRGDLHAVFGEAADDKSGFNVFTQNPWYLGKVLGNPDTLPNLRQLIDHQFEFLRAFEEIIRRPGEQEEVLRAMAVRCLA